MERNKQYKLITFYVALMQTFTNLKLKTIVFYNSQQLENSCKVPTAVKYLAFQG